MTPVASDALAATPPAIPSTIDQPQLRPGGAADAAECGRICFEAFRSIASRHAFPMDFPDADTARGFFSFALAQPGVHVVVAELDGRIVGSNMAWEQAPIVGIGPITVEPELQNRTVGRALMAHVLDRAERRGSRGIRLVQAAYHNRSLALYAKLGFDAREPLSVMQGPRVEAVVSGREVRLAEPRDVPACAALYERLHGFRRDGELATAIAQGTAMVVEARSGITGFATGIGFFAHAVGRTNKDVMALICAAPEFAGPGFLVPTRNSVLMRWCLEHGLRIVQPLTLMSRGFYRKPAGAYLPSILF